MNIQINDHGLVFMKSKQRNHMYYDEDLGEFESETLSIESHCNCSLHNKRATSPKFEYEVIKEEFYDTDKERATPTEVYKHDEINKHDSQTIDCKKIECLNIENTSSEEDNETDNLKPLAEKEMLFNFKEFLKENDKSTLNKKSKRAKLSKKIASEHKSREIKQLDVEINPEVEGKESQITETLISLKKNKTRRSSSIEEDRALNELLKANFNDGDELIKTKEKSLDEKTSKKNHKSGDLRSLNESLQNLVNVESSKDNHKGTKRKSKEPSNSLNNLSDMNNDINMSSKTKSNNESINYKGREKSTKYSKMINQKLKEDSEKDSLNSRKKNETVKLGTSLEILNNGDGATTTYDTYTIETKSSIEITKENIGCTRTKKKAKKRRRNKKNKIVEYMDEMEIFSDENYSNKGNNLPQITKNNDEIKSSKRKRKELANNRKTTNTDEKTEYCNTEKHLYTLSIESDGTNSKISENRSKTSNKRKKELAENAMLHTEKIIETSNLSEGHFDNQLTPTRTIKKKHNTVEETGLEEDLPNVQDNAADVSITDIDTSKLLHILDIPVETCSKKHKSRESKTNIEKDILSLQKNSDKYYKENNKPTSSESLKDNDSYYDYYPIANSSKRIKTKHIRNNTEKSFEEINKTVTSEHVIPDDNHAAPIAASSTKHKTSEQKAKTNEDSYNLPNEIDILSSPGIDVIESHILDSFTTFNNKHKNIQPTKNSPPDILNLKSNSEISTENNMAIRCDSSNEDDFNDVENPNKTSNKQLDIWKSTTNLKNDSLNPQDNSDISFKDGNITLTCDNSKANYSYYCDKPIATSDIKHDKTESASHLKKDISNLQNNSEISYKENNKPVSCESSIRHLDIYKNENPIVTSNEKHENRNPKTKCNSTNSQDMSSSEMDNSKPSDISSQKLIHIIDSPIRTYSRKHKSKIPKIHSKNDNSNFEHNSKASSVGSNINIPRDSSNDENSNKNDNPIIATSSNKYENKETTTNLEKDISNLDNSDIISSIENNKPILCVSSAVGYFNKDDNPKVTSQSDECREPKTNLLRDVSHSQYNLDIACCEENNKPCSNFKENDSNNGDHGTADTYLSTINNSGTSESSKKVYAESNFPTTTLNERNSTEPETISNKKSSNFQDVSSLDIDKSETSDIFSQKLFHIYDSPLRTYINKSKSKDSQSATKTTPNDKLKSPIMPEKKLFPLFKSPKNTSTRKCNREESKSKDEHSNLRKVQVVSSPQEINETIASFSLDKDNSDNSDDNLIPTSNNKHEKTDSIKHLGKDNYVGNPTVIADLKYDKNNRDISSKKSNKSVTSFSLRKDDSEKDEQKAISVKGHKSREPKTKSNNTDSSNSKDDSGILTRKIDETKTLIKEMVDISASPTVTSNIKRKSRQLKIKSERENSYPQGSTDVYFKENNKIISSDSSRKDDYFNKSSKSRKPKSKIKKGFPKRKLKQLVIIKSKSLKFPKTNKWNLKYFLLEKSQKNLVGARSKGNFQKSNKWNIKNFLLEKSQEYLVKARSKGLELRQISQTNPTDNVTEINNLNGSLNELSNSLDTTKHEKEDSSNNSNNSLNEPSNSLDTTKYEKEDTAGKVFPCGTCNEEFISRVLLLKHYNKAHSTDIRCKFCGKTYSKKGNLDRHQNTACENNTNKLIETKPPKVFNCHQCNKFYMRRKELLEHIKILHKDEIKCRYCNKNITRRTNLRRHLVYFCKMNGIVRENNKRLKYGMYANEFVCDYCDKIYTHKQSLITHIKSHMDLKEYYKCSHCEKRYTKRYNLKCHVEGAHMNRKMFTCKYCKIQFTFKWSLIKHEEAHSEGTTRLIPTVKNSAKNNDKREKESVAKK